MYVCIYIYIYIYSVFNVIGGFGAANASYDKYVELSCRVYQNIFIFWQSYLLPDYCSCNKFIFFISDCCF